MASGNDALEQQDVEKLQSWLVFFSFKMRNFDIQVIMPYGNPANVDANKSALFSQD